MARRKTARLLKGNLLETLKNAPKSKKNTIAQHTSNSSANMVNRGSVNPQVSSTMRNMVNKTSTPEATCFTTRSHYPSVEAALDDCINHVDSFFHVEPSLCVVHTNFPNALGLVSRRLTKKGWLAVGTDTQSLTEGPAATRFVQITAAKIETKDQTNEPLCIKDVQENSLIPLTTEGEIILPSEIVSNISTSFDKICSPHFLFFGTNSFCYDKLIDQISTMYPYSATVCGVSQSINSDKFDVSYGGNVFIGEHVCKEGAVGIALPSPTAGFLTELVQSIYGDVEWNKLHIYEDIAALMFQINSHSSTSETISRSQNNYNSTKYVANTPHVPSQDILSALDRLDFDNTVEKNFNDIQEHNSMDDHDEDEIDYDKKLEELWASEEDYDFEREDSDDNIYERFTYLEDNDETNNQKLDSPLCQDLTINLLKVQATSSMYSTSVIYPGLCHYIDIVSHSDRIIARDCIENGVALGVELEITEETRNDEILDKNSISELNDLCTYNDDTGVGTMVEVISIEDIRTDGQCRILVRGLSIFDIHREWYKPMSFGAKSAQVTIREPTFYTEKNAIDESKTSLSAEESRDIYNIYSRLCDIDNTSPKWLLSSVSHLPEGLEKLSSIHSCISNFTDESFNEDNFYGIRNDICIHLFSFWVASILPAPLAMKTQWLREKNTKSRLRLQNIFISSCKGPKGNIK